MPGCPLNFISFENALSKAEQRYNKYIMMCDMIRAIKVIICYKQWFCKNTSSFSRMQSVKGTVYNQNLYAGVDIITGDPLHNLTELHTS